MIAAISPTPRPASSRMPSAIVGAEKRIPTVAGQPSEVSRAAAWARVISIRGEPPITW